MKKARFISRIIVGIVFVFSGTVKAIDPLGTVYKLQDYFQAFHISFLKEFSLLFTIILCTAEFMAGFSVLFNIRQRKGIWIAIIMMIIFTPLTFVLALTNPVTDCGCFGDVIHLTNWETFFKNVVLLAPVLILFINRKQDAAEKGVTREWTMLSITITLFVLFIFYNLRYLPLIDFLPYKTGTYIPDKMIIPEGEATNQYKTTLIYEKDGVKKEFTIENYPAGDTTWKFIDQRSVLIKKGYQPPIHDLTMTTPEGEDITQKILSDPGYTLLMISPMLSKASPQTLGKGLALGHYCIDEGISFYILTASGSDEIRSYNDGISFCLTDETTLKTMVRSNPGYLLLKNGTIVGKWSWANVPSEGELKELTNK